MATISGTTLGVVALVATTVVANTVSDRDTNVESDDVAVTQAGLETDTAFGDVEFISGYAFTPQSDTSVYDVNTSTGCVDIGDTSTMVAEVDLPHGATISSVAAHLHDDGSGGDLTVFLDRFETTATDSGSGPTFDTIFTVDSGNGDDSGYQTRTDSTPATDGWEVIDHNTYTYTLLAVGGGSDPDLCGVAIQYSYADSTALTFHQTEPCAAFDTRPGHGGREARLDGKATETFDLIRSDYSGQGGTSDTSGCSLPAGRNCCFFDNPNGTVAVLLNLVAISPLESGNLKIWDNDDTEPDGGVVVYAPGSNNSNAIATGVDDGFFSFPDSSDGGHVVVKNNGLEPVHVRGVILGYYTTTPKNQE